MQRNCLLLLISFFWVFTSYAQLPELRGSDCNRVNTSLTQFLYANISGGTQYRFKVTNINTGVTDSVTFSSRRFRLSDMPSLSRNGCTYEVQVAIDNGSGLGSYGNICTPSSVAIITKLRNADCGKNLSAISSTVYASVSSADSWDFEVRNTSDPSISEVVSGLPSRAFNLTMASSAFQLYAQEYEVRIRTTQNGVVQPWGDWCSLFTPSIITKLRPSDCGRSLIAMDQSVYATIVTADSWDFEVRNVTDIASTEIINRPDREFKMTYASNPFQLYNQEYEVRVRTIQGGIVQNWGDWCSLFTPNLVPPDITSGCGLTFEYLAYEYVTCTDIGAEQYEFLLRIGTTFVDTVYTNVNQVRIADFLDAANQPNYDYGVTYNIVARGQSSGVWTPYGIGCSITTTSNAHSEVQHLCGAQLNSFNTPISAYAIFNATNYEFRVTDNTLSFSDGVQTVNSSDRKFKLNELANFSYGHEYQVDCRVTFKGVQYDWGSSCVVTAPQPVTKLRNSDCPRLLTSMSQNVYANPVIYDNPSGSGLDPVASYNFRIGVQESGFQSSRAIKLEDILGGPPNASTGYDVQVQVTYNGVVQSWGSACTVTTPSSMILVNEDSVVPNRTSLYEEVVEVYPNPSNESFIIKPKPEYNTSNLQLKLYDLQGVLVSIYENQIDFDSLRELNIGSDLPKGVYYLHVYSIQGFLDSIQLIKL